MGKKFFFYVLLYFFFGNHPLLAFPEECPNDPIPIPGHTFTQGQKDSLFLDEGPVHHTKISDFSLSPFETTSWEFAQWIITQKIDFPYAKMILEEAEKEPCRPARGMNWFLARDYCQSKGGRLPTEAEWEYAATMDTLNGFTQYPWTSGNQPPRIYDPDNFNEEEIEEEEESEETQMVFPELFEVQYTFQGMNRLQGMSGNVWEWVEDWYAPYSAESQVNPKGPGEGFWKVLRGGSYQNSSQIELLRPTLRNQATPQSFFYQAGFRCAWKR